MSNPGKAEPRARVRAAMFAFVLFASAAFADDDIPQDIAPLQGLLEAIHDEFPGRILEIELDDEDGGWIYEVKVLTAQGHVLKLEYDAMSLELVGVTGRHDSDSD